MRVQFSFIILLSVSILSLLIFFLHLCGLVTATNEVYARFGLLGVFTVGFLLLVLQKSKSHKFSLADFYKNDTFISIALLILLVSSFLYSEVGYYTIGLFVLAAFIHFLYTRKFYPPNKIFYFVILYALLQFFGTIGTEKGFHFPDRTLCYYLLPLSLCFFRLSKQTLLCIGELFFKSAIIFLAVCMLYWWYNFLHLDANFIDWITTKTGYSVEMIGWKTQARTINSQSIEIYGEGIFYFQAYFFVNSWAYFYHPTFVSFVLFSALITGLYLYLKKDTTVQVSRFEMILYIVFCFFVVILMESRVGLVGFLFIITATSLYYLKQKTNYFKTVLIFFLLLGCTALYMSNDTVSDFANDDIRDAYRRIAVSYIQDHFWWGSGFRQEQIALQQQAEIMKDVLPQSVYPHVDVRIYHAHNQFLGDMVQFGIWGLLALLAMLTAIGYHAIKKRSYLLQMFLCIVVLLMMIDEPLYISYATIRFVTFLVFFTAIAEGRSKSEKI